ncbi:MAG TPA: bifunctional UDP-N-acetylmuramoyl-tripeptide:D-alanyl-D-alanine ligase/alanine racemase [Flavobacteriales bacterium]|nr:bifunctional UDP-N-acetylmuramoyl-tripeptide:D-alanyl-D-alanine ligase/alanine racemase [Flavobacteriales bacterium]
MSGARYPLSTIARAVGGTFGGPSDPVIEHLLIDSRKALVATDVLFIALKGPRHDGHRYINELYARGLRNFMVSDAVDEIVLRDANVIRVPDTLSALQALAAWHRSHFSYPVIGITGSNGKTIVKEWLFQMLHREENIVRSPGSWNSQVGVPLSVWQMGTEHTLGIFEAGISMPGEMEKLEPIIRPTIGVFTHVGTAHQEEFGPRLGRTKEEEKIKLFEHSEVWVYEDDLKELRKLNYQIPGVKPREWAFEYGDQHSYLEVTKEEKLQGSTLIHVRHGGAAHIFTIPFTDRASFDNALTCATVCLHLGRSLQWIGEKLAQLEPVSMRLRTMQGVHGTTLIDDSYSMDDDSLLIALRQLRNVSRGRRMIAVLSDLPESDGRALDFYSKWAKSFHHPTKDGSLGPELIAVGPTFLAHREAFHGNARFHASVEELLAKEDPVNFAGAVVLIKGARRFGFERIVQRWQQQVHGTELEIDLEAIRHNLNHYRALLAPGVRTMAMVKAFGYGSGALELARLFEHERVHYLGVAYADEGIELRSHGITMPIMVMNPEPVDMGTLHRFRLEAEVYDQRSLHEAIAAAKQMDDAPPVHIKLDTGMHRLGFVESELALLLDALRNEPKLKVASILSHLVASEDPVQDEFTRTQLAAFTRMATAIGEVLGYKPLWHIANSAGTSRWPQAHFDMVRVGIGLHGIGVDEEETKRLMPTLTLRAPIAQIKQLTTGDTVGYNRKGIINGERTIATLPLGYADGFSRRLGNGVGCVWVNGQRAPIIGNVCMDMCMVDVSGIACQVGDMAIVFDAQHPVTEVAQAMGTIPYEVLTGISQRVKRVYVRG